MKSKLIEEKQDMGKALLGNFDNRFQKRVIIKKAEKGFWYERLIGKEVEIKEVLRIKNSFDPSIVRVEYRACDRYRYNEIGQMDNIGCIRAEDAEIVGGDYGNR